MLKIYIENKDMNAKLDKGNLSYGIVYIIGVNT